SNAAAIATAASSAPVPPPKKSCQNSTCPVAAITTVIASPTGSSRCSGKVGSSGASGACGAAVSGITGARCAGDAICLAGVDCSDGVGLGGIAVPCPVSVISSPATIDSISESSGVPELIASDIRGCLLSASGDGAHRGSDLDRGQHPQQRAHRSEHAAESADPGDQGAREADPDAHVGLLVPVAAAHRTNSVRSGTVW